MKVPVFFLLLTLIFLGFAVNRKQACLFSKKKLLEQVQEKDEISQSLSYYNDMLHSQLRKLVQQTQLELSASKIIIPKDIKMSYYFLGSLAKKTAIPYSDLEFGVIVSKKSQAVKKYINAFMKVFCRKLKMAGYCLDQNGWYPPFQKKHGLKGKEIFLATPNELQTFIKKGKNLRVRASLLQTHFFYGDKKLYEKCLANQRFKDQIESLKEEFSLIKKHIDSNLKMMMKALDQKKFTDKESFNFKSYLIQPIELLIFYLGQYYHIPYESSFDLIEQLEEKNHISQKQKQKLIDALSFSIKKRLFYKDKSIAISKLSKGDITLIRRYISFIFDFHSFVESSLSA